MHLTPLDWLVALLSVAICFVPAFFVAKRSGKSTTEFFAAAWFAVKHVGGLGVMVEKLTPAMTAPDGKTVLNYLNILPDFTHNWDLALAPEWPGN